MKIRKAVSVVLMLSFLVSYSNAVPIFCKHEKSKLNQCRAELNHCRATMTLLKSNCEREARKANESLQYMKCKGKK